MKFKKIILAIAVSFLIGGCGVNTKARKLAKEKCDTLLDAIGDGKANDLFPTKYFPPEQTVTLMDDLKINCDFKKRKGNFINDYYEKIIGGDNKIILIYEFYLKCDTVRFLISYLEKDNHELELNGFKMEPVNKPNNMILRKDRQLKFSK